MKLLTHETPDCEDCQVVKASGQRYEYCPDCGHYYWDKDDEFGRQVHSMCKAFNVAIGVDVDLLERRLNEIRQT